MAISLGSCSGGNDWVFDNQGTPSELDVAAKGAMILLVIKQRKKYN